MSGGPMTRVLGAVARSVAVFAVVAALVSSIGTGVRLLAGTVVAIGGNSNPTSASMIQELGGNPLPPGTVNPTGLPLGVAGHGYLDPGNANSPYYGYDFKPVTWPSQIPFTTTWDGSSGYEQSQRAGLTNLQALVQPALQTGDPVAVVGYSSGANVVIREMRYLQSIGAPDADRLSFMLIASMNRPNGGLAGRFPGLFLPFINVKFDGTTPANTPYKTVDVSWQYDPVSDFPNYPLNLLADLNALVGFYTQHGDYYPADMNGPRAVPDYTDPASNVTYVTLAAPRLPLLVPLRLLGVPKQLLDLVEPALKVLVDLGYDRSIKPGVVAPASLSPTPLRLLALPGQLLDAVGVGIQHALNPSWDKPAAVPDHQPAAVTAAAPAATATLGTQKAAETPVKTAVAESSTTPSIGGTTISGDQTDNGPSAPAPTVATTHRPDAVQSGAEQQSKTSAGADAPSSPRSRVTDTDRDEPAPRTSTGSSGESGSASPATGGKHTAADTGETHAASTAGQAGGHSEDAGSEKAAA